jgi:hypothetical protein
MSSGSYPNKRWNIGKLDVMAASSVNSILDDVEV